MSVDGELRRSWGRCKGDFGGVTSVRKSGCSKGGVTSIRNVCQLMGRCDGHVLFLYNKEICFDLWFFVLLF